MVDGALNTIFVKKVDELNSIFNSIQFNSVTTGEALEGVARGGGVNTTTAEATVGR